MNDDRESIKKDLLKILNRLPVHQMTSNKKEISIRCPYCGDSRKALSHSHLYINIDTDSDNFLQYYCQRCKAKGFTNSEFLKNINSYDQNLVINIEKESKKNKSKNYKRFKKIKKKNFNFPEYDKRDSINKVKLNYINKRIGAKLDYDDLKKYKIILNLYDTLTANKVSTLTCKDNMGDTLDDNFIGFVSYDNNYIIMRNLSKTVLPEMRYYNYNIYDDYNNTKKFYFIPAKINTMTERITLVISEGVFDILNVYFHIEKETENKLFAAVCGIGYNGVIQEVIRMGFLDIDLVIYGDNDQDIEIYRGIKEDNKPFIRSITLYTNKKSKDFGDYKFGYELRKTKL